MIVLDKAWVEVKSEVDLGIASVVVELRRADDADATVSEVARLLEDGIACVVEFGIALLLPVVSETFDEKIKVVVDGGNTT